MAVFQCKMCGASLEVEEGVNVCKCDYCGTANTIPRNREENTVNLFNRANVLRSKCEFDRAQDIYEKIVQEDPTEPEAYWGLVLCEYGIEYVEDPVTRRKVPTCHRTQLESVLSAADYQSALEYADVIQREAYENEAVEIDRLQKKILAIAKAEKPFDVFLCYKETDDAGRRTQDSVTANDIYHQLTQEGFKVFYAPITLEDKLGQDYEPYIFSALNSARVMLAIGTKPEYFQAVWVRNEWSRYLKIIKDDRSKLLIPCYKDMDAYDLPVEFAHLQAQDMGKIGFLQDIIRGIRKVLAPPEKAENKKETPKSASAQTKAPADPEMAYVERGFLFLEDGKWTEADRYFEKALDIDPKNARAYLGKLLADLRLTNVNALADLNASFDDKDNYQKVLRFGDEQMVEMLENSNRQAAYNYAQGLYRHAHTVEECERAASAFASLGDYADAGAKVKECRDKACQLRYEEAQKILEQAQTPEDCEKAREIFEDLGSYADASAKVKECRDKVCQLRYEEAQKIMIQAVVSSKDCEKAAKIFLDLGDYADALERAYDVAVLCMKEAGVSTDFKIAAELFQALGTYSDAAELRVQCLNRMKKCEQREFRLGRAILIGIAIVIVTVIAVPIVRKQILSARESRAYQEAMKLYEQGDYAAASSAFAALDDYKDSDKMEIYANAISLYEDGSYSAVINFLDVRNLGFVDQVTQELSGMAALHMSDVGDKVVFGGGRTWTVLERQGNQLLLYARGTENLPFDEQGSANDWENCSLRETLNASYYADNFNQREQKVILETDTSDTTKDKIFVLSAEEADRYQTPLNSRYDGLTTRFRNMERALTRTVENGEVVCISLGSYFEYTTCDIDRSYDVHPAMWIDLDLYEW